MGIAPSASSIGSGNAFAPAGATADADAGARPPCCCRPRPPDRRRRPTHPPRPPAPPSAPASSRRRPPPKKLLWGCASAEEHYEHVDEVCARIEHLHGAEGLQALGLEYRVVHHPLACTCDGDLVDDDDWQLQPSREEEEARSLSSFSDESSYSQPPLDCEEEYLVPLGTALNAARGSDVPALAASPSSASLFSLATHHTRGSAEGRDEREAPDDGCALRLFRVFPSTLDGPPILVAADNYESFVAPGTMYDEVARLCMEHAQEVMLREGRLRWVTICKERRLRALVSDARTTDPAPAGAGRRPVLLVVTGKGTIRAGVFSRRHLMTRGMEAGTALPMVREARRRGLDAVLLDPNANGDVNGMDTVAASLRHLFPAATAGREQGVYVVAHSAAGAQIVRYMLGSRQVGTGADASSAAEGQAFARSIRAIAFTDSNHNINWARDDPALTQFLTGRSCLYLKAHKVRQDGVQEPGAPHRACEFWRHRFGAIRTVWAGTDEHSLTNYAPRRQIWEHFGACLATGGNGDREAAVSF